MQPGHLFMHSGAIYRVTNQLKNGTKVVCDEIAGCGLLMDNPHAFLQLYRSPIATDFDMGMVPDFPEISLAVFPKT